MHDPLAMNVIEGLAQGESNADGALRGKLFLFVQDLAQQAAVHPFQNHVAAAALFIVEYANDAGMIEFFADFLFALEAVEQDRVGFHFLVGNLDRDGAPVARVRAAENRGHAASGDQAIDAVMIERDRRDGIRSFGKAGRRQTQEQQRTCISTVYRDARDTFPFARRPGFGSTER